MIGIPLMLALFVVQAPSADKGSDSDVRCGSYCLYVALNAMDLEPGTFESFEQRIGPPGPQGYSVQQLQLAAEEAGAQTLAAETTLENLIYRDRDEDFACVTMVNENHFVLLYEVNADGVSVIDPPSEYQSSLSTFEKVWNGRVLLLSVVPLRAEESVAWSRSVEIILWRTGLAVLGTFLASVAILLAVRFWKARSIAAAVLIGIGLTVGCGESAIEPNETVAVAAFNPWLTFEKTSIDLGTIVR